jgi:hypothetical protein
VRNAIAIPFLLALCGISPRFSASADTPVPDAARAADSVAGVPEAGPENGGLRLALSVISRAQDNKTGRNETAANKAAADQQGFGVRLDLANVSTGDIKLRAAWTSDTETGDLKDYLDAATSIETYPAIAPWRGGVGVGHRTTPQPEQILKAGEVLTVRWQTDARRLKNRVTDPIQVQNPEFPTPGLYSVHAKLTLSFPTGGVMLRSNEVLVPVGNSRELPKHTYGQLWNVDSDAKVGTLNLGSLHKIQPGDEFVHLSKIGSWKLTITDVQPDYSVGNLEPLPFPGGAIKETHPLPQRGDDATLAPKK